MMRFNLQLFGGRSGSSGMNSSTSSGGNSLNALRSQYDAASRERDELWNQGGTSWLSAASKMRNITAQALDIAPDSAYDRGVEKFFNEWDGSQSSKDRLLKTLSGTKKDGSPTRSASNNADDYGERILTDVATSLGFGTNPAEFASKESKDRSIKALYKYAKKNSK